MTEDRQLFPLSDSSATLRYTKGAPHMSDTTATNLSETGPEPTIDSLVDAVAPMGDLSVFALDDLDEQEEARFFQILEEA